MERVPFYDLSRSGPSFLTSQGETRSHTNGAFKRRKQEALECLKKSAVLYHGVNVNDPKLIEKALSGWLTEGKWPGLHVITTYVRTYIFFTGIGGIDARSFLSTMPEQATVVKEAQDSLLKDIRTGQFSTENIVYQGMTEGRLTCNGLVELRKLQAKDKNVIGATKHTIAEENRRALEASEQKPEFLALHPKYDLKTVGSLRPRTITWLPGDEPTGSKGYGVQVESVVAVVDVLNQIASQVIAKPIHDAHLKLGWDWAVDGSGGTLYAHVNHLLCPTQDSVAVLCAANVKDNDENIISYFYKPHNSVIKQVRT